MQQRPLGRSGLNVSVVGLGCNNFGWLIDEAASSEVIARALDFGINFFDTADVYGDSEQVLGKALAGRRPQVIIATKFGIAARGLAGGASREYVMRAAERSLSRLHTEYLDVLYLHRPDPTVPLEETLQALEELIRQGKIRHAAASNMTPELIEQATRIAAEQGLHGFVATQEHLNLLVRGAEGQLLPAARRAGMAVIPYFPLASGMLTGKYRRGAPPPAGSRIESWKHLGATLFTPENFERVERLQSFAAARGHSVGELAIAWLLARPPVASVIAGATRATQIEANTRAADWVLSAADQAEIDRIAPSVA
jgi:aryl-alcohol dehydrogenase-like predicted oxidoreductase